MDAMDDMAYLYDKHDEFTTLNNDDFPVGKSIEGKCLTCGWEKCSVVAQTVRSHHVLQGGCNEVLWLLHTDMMPHYQIFSLL